MCSVAHPASRRHTDTVHAAFPLTGESTVCALDDKKNDTTAQSGWWATVWPFRALAGSSCLTIMTIDLAAPSLPPPRGVGVSNTLQFAKNCRWQRTPPCDCGGGHSPKRSVGCRLAIPRASRLITPARPGYSPGGAVTSTTPQRACGQGGVNMHMHSRARPCHVHELWYTPNVLHARIKTLNPPEHRTPPNDRHSSCIFTYQAAEQAARRTSVWREPC